MTFRLAPALISLLLTTAAAARPDPVRLDGVAHTDDAVDVVTVAVWALDPPADDPNGHAFAPLVEMTVAPGEPFGVELPPGADLPVEVELHAEGHVAVRRHVVVEADRRMPPAWLRVGEPMEVDVDVPDGETAVVDGLIITDAWFMDPRRWQACIPRTTVTGDPVSVTAPERYEGIWSRTTLTDGTWASRRFQHRRDRLHLEPGSDVVAVKVVDDLGEPVAGAVVVPDRAPAGTAVVTGEDGAAEVSVHGDSWAVVARSGDRWARTSGSVVPEQPVELVLAPRPDLLLRWPRPIGEAAVQLRWIPVAIGGSIRAVETPAASVPAPWQPDRLTIWSPTHEVERQGVDPGVDEIAVVPEASGRLEGLVSVAGQGPAVGVPVWVHLPETHLIQRSRSLPFRVPLERPWLPWAVTDADGSFRTTVPSTELFASTETPGLPAARSDRVAVEPARTAAVELVLRPGTRITLQAVDVFGAPVEGATASMVVPREPPGRVRMSRRFGASPDEGAEPEATAATDGDGRAVLQPVPVGPAEVRVKAPGFVARRIDSLEVPAEGLDLGLVELEFGHTVKGVVVDPDGDSVADATVHVSDDPAAVAGDWNLVTEPDGRFELEDLEAETELYLTADADGWVAAAPVKVTVPADGPVEVPVEPEKVLEGRLVDADTDSGVGGARVHAMATVEVIARGRSFSSVRTAGSAESGSDGSFRLAGLSAGTIQLAVEAADYRSIRRELILPADGDPDPIVLRLDRGLELTGTVLDADGTPAPAVHVSARPASQSAFGMIATSTGSATTDSAGRFRLAGLAPGEHTVMAGTDDGRRTTEMIELATDVANEIVLRFERTVTLLGRLLDPDGAPVPGAKVGAFGEMNRLAADTGPDGSFRIEGVTPGSWWVYADVEGYSPAREQVEVPETGPPDPVVLELTRGGTVIGRVVGLTGTQIDSCRISAAGASTQPNTDGTFRLEGVRAGSQQIRAELGFGGRSRSVQVDVPEGGEASPVEIDFAGGLMLSGVVLRAGYEVPGVVVSAVNAASETGGTTTSNTDGAFEISGLDPGEVVVTVMSRTGETLGGDHLVLESDAEIELTLDSGRLHGRVLAADTGQPVTTASLQAVRAGTPAIERRASTDTRGAFEIDRLPDGTWAVEVTADGYAPARRMVELVDGLAPETVVELDPESRVVLRVSSASGRPVSSIWMTTSSGGIAGENVAVQCDADGRCTVRDLATGVWTVLVRDGDEAAILSLTAPGGEVPVTLRPTGVLRIDAPPDADGVTWSVRVREAASGLVLPVGRWANPTLGEWTPVPAAGLRLGVPAGAWLVEASRPDGRTEIWTAEVTGGETVTVGP